MKLRFRKNSLRLRLNQTEVHAIAKGTALKEQIHFPNGTSLTYVLKSAITSQANTTFQNGTIEIAAPHEQIQDWAHADSIGMYFDLPANETNLKIAIEKDLVCIDGPEEERDPDAFPRTEPAAC